LEAYILKDNPRQAFKIKGWIAASVRCPENVRLPAHVHKTGGKFAMQWPYVSKLMLEIKVPSNVDLGA
jgi:hypothetical protein